MLLVEALALNKCLLGEMKYIFTKQKVQKLVIEITANLVGYVFKNANLSNNSGVSKRDDKSFSSHYVLDGTFKNTCI